MRYGMDQDEIGMMYEEEVEAGKIDPAKVSMADYIEDILSGWADDAYERAKDEAMERAWEAK